MSQPTRPRVAVVGAGWAGLAAAVTLADRAELTVFEAGRVVGGRARRLAAPASVPIIITDRLNVLNFMCSSSTPTWTWMFLREVMPSGSLRRY